MKVEASVLGATTQNGAAGRSGAERAPDEAKAGAKAKQAFRDQAARRAKRSSSPPDARAGAEA